jgi:glutamyl-tRNA synthetase
MSATINTADADMPKVVTRFAPSPTGFLHIGGARTALFNWLFARANGGDFRLRIEDTDRARSTDAAISAILDGMEWLGLDWDGETVYQFARADRHAQAANMLVDHGLAYRCFLSTEELADMRAKAQANRTPFRVASPWRDADPASSPADKHGVVRLKAALIGATQIDDLVQGTVTVQNNEIDDFVLLRSDGTPTYMLSVVVDDHDMGVTHVIRGDDHLNNAFRQIALIRALDTAEGGWSVPTYAHVPLIHGADGAKLSKRHGAIGVDAYRDEMGLLPEAVRNYLMRLGWGHGDDEIISTEQAIAWFTLEGVGRSPSRFDSKKLENLNAHYLRESYDTRLADLTCARLSSDGIALPPDALERIKAAIPVLKPRAKTLIDLAAGAAFLFHSVPLVFDDKAVAQLDEAGLAIVGQAYTALADERDWTAEHLDLRIRALAETMELGLGKIAQPLRAALTGSTTSPGIFDVLILLGQAESLARLKSVLKL